MNPTTQADDHLGHVAGVTTHELPHAPGKNASRGRLVGGYIVRTLLALVFGLPLLFMIVSSFLFNSIMISAVTVVLGLLINSMAAFALARLNFRGKRIILTVVIATLIVPFETLALPLLWWVNKLPWLDANGFSFGWLDTYQVQIVPFVANAFSIYLFYQFFDSIPKELDEAAVVDGAGWYRIYRSIVMPLSGPAMATV